MKVTKNIGLLLLSIWLILTGLTYFVAIAFSGFGSLMSILAIAAGVLLLTGK